ncbi:MAG: DNA translocase FtsK, partial [Eubacterium sp.]|nr:DNA translocase FtsK [Eubacterium sp.]
EEAKEKFSRRKDDYYDPDESEAQAEIKVKKETLTPKRQRPAREPKSAAIELPPPEPKKPDYIFPPIDLLPYKEQTSGDSQREMENNAQKIIETLEDFNIHTRLVGISRGPAVTRYEIAPQQGTKVSAIINRSDDISLSLASTVRISGVIPGKSAIGIEVPNKNVSTVYLRSLIDCDNFRNAKSKVTAGLGVDLAGTKVYLDVAKMPHLLIAGATGMGKSVCMNSLIVSILYKARPDEVKFIFIDPKKVEFSMYNGIPHLLVPVVFDPKKAAGALHWAVTEMERRYDILESTGKRNLAQYNEATKDDPTAEKLPQIIIVIDELADLMTVAPDDVEMSINRIAAKARAAGMHLLVGTQRPSVDVITGTIKSNIPSRIACKTSSQIDSRTILDTAGAEKLIGRGDMLFSPVGSMSPMRVQGSFVDAPEIEKIVAFIKEHSEEKEYDSKIVDTINKEAELCGKKGRSQSGTSDESGGDEPEDNMLNAAIELAIDEKKISTSLIQRRLSLGYGRAAKLIDVMERRGIVSAPDGQKPRSVLITREQYYEMQMRNGGKANNGEEDDAPWED